MTPLLKIISLAACLLAAPMAMAQETLKSVEGAVENDAPLNPTEGHLTYGCARSGGERLVLDLLLGDSRIKIALWGPVLDNLAQGQILHLTNAENTFSQLAICMGTDPCLPIKGRLGISGYTPGYVLSGRLLWSVGNIPTPARADFIARADAEAKPPACPAP